MKQIKIASAIALAMGLAVAGSASAASSSGTITFNGSVSDATCTVSGGAGTDGGAKNFSVRLDEATPGELATAGVTAHPKAFDVKIGGPTEGSCVDGKIATMSFLTSSTPIDAATGRLNNVLANEATNVQIQLSDANGVINLADPTYSIDSPAIANHTALIPFSAEYYATGAATPGLVSTNVVYKMTYN